MKLPESWPIYALMVFAVASGQIGRLGQKYERGMAIGGKQIVVEMTMLPAFGALGGALATQYHWPIWATLAVGISAGWAGFATFRLIATATRAVGQQMFGIKTDAPPPGA